jgi:hypothetical protein
MATDDYPKTQPVPRIQYVDITWWSAHLSGKQAHEFLIGHVQDLRRKQATRYWNMKKLISIYEWGFKAWTVENGEEPPLNEDVNAYNAAASTVNTIHSKVFKNDLIPMPVTTGGGALQRSRAKDLGKGLRGVYAENDVDLIEEDAGYDAMICGAGFGKTYQSHGRVKVRFVPADDMTMDDAEGRYRCPPSIFETTRMDRFQCLAEYGGTGDAEKDSWLHGTKEHRCKMILQCREATQEGGAINAGRDQIEITEAYHLPSGPDAGDGRMVVAIDGCTLVDVEWKRPRFRHHLMIPMRRRRGSWGLSLMHDLAANQKEYETGTEKIQRAHRTMGGSHILAHVQSKVDERTMDNGIGTVIEWDGNAPPQAFNPEPVHPQTYAHFDSIPDKMLSRHGVSSMSARGEIPAGLSQASGKALQVFDDIEAEGLRAYHAERRRWHKSVSQGIIDEARELVEQGASYSVRHEGRGALEAVDWKDVIMDEEDYVLSVPSVNALSTSPAAKYERMEAELNAGTITVDQYKRLNVNPDLQAENDIDTADVDIIDRNLDLMVVKGEYLAPQSFDNLQLYVQRAGKFYNLERAKGTPDDRLQLIRDAIAEAQQLLNPPPDPMAAPPGPPPMGPGMMPPPPMDPGMPPMGPPMGDPGMPPPDMMPPPPMAA